MDFVKKMWDKVRSIFLRKKTLPEPAEFPYESDDEEIITSGEKNDKVETSSKEEFKGGLKKIDGKLLKEQIIQKFKTNTEEMYLQKFIDMGVSAKLFDNIAARKEFIEKEKNIINWLTEHSISQNEANLNRLKDEEKYDIDLFEKYYARLKGDFLRNADDVLQNNDNTVIENNGNKIIRRRIDRIYNQGLPKTNINSNIYEIVGNGTIITQRKMHSECYNRRAGLTSQEDISKAYDLNGKLIANSSVYKEAVEPGWYTDEALMSTLYLDRSKQLEKDRAIVGLDQSQGVEIKNFCRVDSYPEGTYFTQQKGNRAPVYATEIEGEKMNTRQQNTKLYDAKNIQVFDKNDGKDKISGFFKGNDKESEAIKKKLDNSFVQNIGAKLKNNDRNLEGKEY